MGASPAERPGRTVQASRRRVEHDLRPKLPHPDKLRAGLLDAAQEKTDLLQRISYIDFLRQYANIPKDLADIIRDTVLSSEGAGFFLEQSFDEFEASIMGQFDAMLGDRGFDAERDIAAITINRWPHGYAYEYKEIGTPDDWGPEKGPHIANA